MKKRIIKFGIPLLALVAILITIPLFTVAASPGQGRPIANINRNIHTIQGEVTSITGDVNAASILVTRGDNQKVTITTNTTTEYYMGYTGKVKQTIRDRFSNLKKWVDRRFGKNNSDEEIIPENWGNQLGRLDPSCKEASFDDLTIGDRIIARVDSINVATRIIIIKTTAIQQVKGNVIVSANTVTITKTDGTTVGPITWDANTRFIIKGTLNVAGSHYGIVIYNTEANTAKLVNLVAEQPTNP